MHEISKCKTLSENLDQMADVLKEREIKVATKELEEHNMFMILSPSLFRFICYSTNAIVTYY